MSRPSTPNEPHAPALDVSAAACSASRPADTVPQAHSISHTSSPDVRKQGPSTPHRPTLASQSSRGRLTPRYPSRLTRGDPGRVPLHKRGTSRTYERLEDLLREAGYKETKIFSPETERTGSRGEGQKDGRSTSVRGGVGAVVDFLTGWMPGSSKADEHDSSANEEPMQQRSPPPSPLSGKRTRKQSSLRPVAVEDLSDTPSSLGSPKRRYGRMPYSHSTSSEHSPLMQSSASDSLRTHVQLSAAQGYLRHIASTPNISKKAQPDRSSGPSKLKFIRGEEPPLPSNWFDSVTRAVLGSSSSAAHVGGPAPTTRSPHRSGRSSKENRPASHSTKNKVRPVTGYLRSATAPSAVNTVRVVCRSAPASRSSSRVGDRLARVTDKGKARELSRPRNLKSRSAGSDVPTLASMRLENDSWNLQWLDGERVSSAVSDNELSDDDDDDDEGELDLARILVPPKRQKSIRSLRQHLHRSESARALRGDCLRPLEPWMPHDDDEPQVKHSGSARLSSRRGSMEDAQEYGSSWNIHGYQQSGSKKRRTIPGTWSSHSLRR